METTSMEKAEYELRNLMASDVFLMTNIINKIGIKEFSSFFESDDVMNMSGKVNIERIGLKIIIDMAGTIISNVSKAEKEIYAFLSALSGMNEKEIAELDAVIFASMIIDVFRKEQFKDFMKVVSKLFN